MKTIRNAASLVAIAGLLFTASAVAQVSEDGLGKVIPVELFACTFNDGQDASDFDKVTERWNEFMDDPEFKIVRPRQVFTGAARRDYVPMASRKTEAG